MAYKPFAVQVAAHNALLVDNYKRAMLYWSRRCFIAGTPITLADGTTKPIEEIHAGDTVLSFTGEAAEPNEVIKLHRFGLDEDPKPMLDLQINDKHFTVSYDHPFFVGRDAVPIIELVWGAMVTSERLQFQLLCEQYGSPLDDETLRRLQNSSDETSPRWAWVLQDNDGRPHSKSTSSDSTDVATESLQQTTSESHRQQQNEQPSGQSRMGDTSRESSTHDEAGQTVQKRRREVRNAHTDGGSGYGNTPRTSSTPDYLKTSIIGGTSKEVSPQSGEYTPHLKRENLEISQVKVLPTTECYDLEVNNVSSYFANGIAVSNTGKTLWSVQQIMMSVLMHQGPHHIVFKEYQQAETVAWNQYLHLIPKGLIEGIPNKQTLTVTFKRMNGKIKLPISKGSCKTINGNLEHFDDCDCVVVTDDPSKPPATLRFLGSDKADSHRGGESFGMIFDEYQDQDHYGWDFVYRQFLYTTGGWAVFMGTAKAEDEWINMLENAEMSYIESQKEGRERRFGDWYYSKATWRANPLIKPEIIEADREQAEKEGKMGAFLQETELIPFSLQGAVYPMYSKKTHHVHADKVPLEGTDYIALDFGFAEGHPMAACFVRITRDDIWYQWDEINGVGIQMDDLIGEIKSKMGDRKLTGIICDSARPDLIDYMASKGMPVIPAPKKQNSVAAGIQLFSKRLRPKIQVMGEPKPNFMIDTVACPKTHYDFLHYRYKEVKTGQLAQENPDKKHDDSLDALRYLELFFKFGLKTVDKLPQNSMLKDVNSFGLL